MIIVPTCYHTLGSIARNNQVINMQTVQSLLRIIIMPLILIRCCASRDVPMMSKHVSGVYLIHRDAHLHVGRRKYSYLQSESTSVMIIVP